MSFDVFTLRLGLAVVAMVLAAGAVAIVKAVSLVQRTVVDIDNRAPAAEDSKKCA